MTIEVVGYRQLKHLGVPVNLAGYKYLKEAILLALEDPSIIRRMTQKMYPAIANVHGTTASRVERAIRHAIEYVYENTDHDILCKYFGNTVSAASGKLTNTQFISGVAEYIKMEVTL